jgi:hypothetical protein
MILRYAIENNKEYVVNTHVLIKGQWSPAAVVPRGMSDDAVSEILRVPNWAEAETVILFGDPEAAVKKQKTEDWLEKRRAYHRDYYRQRKTNGKH